MMQKISSFILEMPIPLDVKGAGDQTRPQWVGSSVIYFTSERGGDMWDVAISSGASSSKTLAKDIRLPFRAAPALSPDGKWVAYGLESPDKANSIWLTKVDGSKTVAIKTPHKALCGAFVNRNWWKDLPCLYRFAI